MKQPYLDYVVHFLLDVTILWNLSLIGPVVSEKEMFENVDGRMPESLVYY